MLQYKYDITKDSSCGNTQFATEEYVNLTFFDKSLADKPIFWFKCKSECQILKNLVEYNINQRRDFYGYNTH